MAPLEVGLCLQITNWLYKALIILVTVVPSDIHTRVSPKEGMTVIFPSLCMSTPAETLLHRLHIHKQMLSVGDHSWLCKRIAIHEHSASNKQFNLFV